ncbi:MAG: class I SAM-dependent methyltransferase [Planctomycetota bacterium]
MTASIAQVIVIPGPGARAPDREAARALADSLGCAYIPNVRDASDETIWLRYRPDGLELIDPRESRHAMRLEYADIDLRPGGRSLSKRQPLAKALGRDASTVLDATAGFGRDSVLFAALGYDVIACERVPIVATMLGAAMGDESSAVPSELRARIRVMSGDARNVLPSLAESPDVVYVDPMFPEKRKTSALPKKRIRMLRELVGDDDDAAQLLEVAREHVRRVVVKRADDAPELAPRPTVVFKGKTVRYDVYVQNGG